MTDDEAVRRLASRYVWWQTPEETLARSDHFLCQLMQLATADDMQQALRIFGEERFSVALRHAPAGILDGRSWNFWHRMLLGVAPPPPPIRVLPR